MRLNEWFCFLISYSIPEVIAFILRKYIAGTGLFNHKKGILLKVWFAFNADSKTQQHWFFSDNKDHYYKGISEGKWGEKVENKQLHILLHAGAASSTALCSARSAYPDLNLE